MKGIVFVVVKRALREEGEAAADDVWEETGLPSSPEKTRDYADTDLQELISAAQARLDGSDVEIAQRLGRRAAGELANEYPSFFISYDSVVGFVSDLDDEIHPNVLKLFPEADFPTFDARASEDADLEIIYQSDRGLCHLAEGLIVGTADRYQETVEIQQPECTHRGDSRCRLLLDVKE